MINRPFAVINADDYYGQDSFKVLCNFLSNLPEESKGEYSMVGFRLKNTLSLSGTVSRGICAADSDGYLTHIQEHTNIKSEGDTIIGQTLDGEDATFDNNTITSMNMWGFTPDFLEESEIKFIEFLKHNINEPKKEFYVPSIVGEMISEKKATVKVLDTTSSWFGVTYKEDRDMVVENFAKMAKKGIYPAKMF